MDDLIKHPHIITVDRVGQGADLLVEYSVPNLSFFNKQHRELLHKHKSLLQASGIFVVIVKHLFERKYLVEHPKYDGIIICGDRDIFRLNKRQDKVMGMLHENAKTPLINIARKLGLDPKTIVLLKKHLESRKVVLKYTATLNYELASIRRSYIFLQPAYEDTGSIDKLINYTRRHKNITGAFKIIGSYELMLVVEKRNPAENVIKDLRRHFQVSKYWIVDSDRVVKEEFMPRIL
jgi:DNA-binding Lrp family transcriptional regulator